MSAAATSKEKEIVLQFRALAADPENRPYIVSQGCLPGLVLFLAHPDEEIIYIALEALDYISQHKAHRARMAKEPGLGGGLRKLMLHANIKIKSLAITIYSSIQEHFSDRPEPAREVIVSRAEKSEAVGNGDVLTSMFSENVATKISHARTYHLYIKGLATGADELKQKVDGVLIGIKGLVSFLVDIGAGKAIIRTLAAVDTVTAALRAAGIVVSGIEEHGDPNKTYTKELPTQPAENKENGGGAGGAGGAGWWGWTTALVTTSDNGTWWSGSTPRKKKTTQQQNDGMLGKLGKALWG